MVKSFSLALSSILTSKMRSFLTMLGMVVGVAAVIILVSLVDGMTNEMITAFESFGTTSININVNNRSSNKKVEPEQLYNFVEENPELYMGVSPKVTVQGAKIRLSGSETIQTSMTGVSEQYDKISALNVTDGRFLSYGEVSYGASSCVIGTYIKNEVFPFEEAVGKTIKISGHTFSVVGVLEEKGDSTETSSDNCIYIPYTKAQSLSKTKTISSYVVGAKNEEIVKEATDKIKGFLEKCLGDDDYFSATNMMEILNVVNDLIGIMKMMLVAIAGISLLVAGIGIMNIMLVSVTERTREIGIRKSLGAKRRDIMKQFVIEAGLVSGIGGVIGIVLGAIVSYVIGKGIGITAVPSFSTIVVSCSVSVGIGILFGFLPANKAAKLNPIDALRHD